MDRKAGILPAFPYSYSSRTVYRRADIMKNDLLPAEKTYIKYVTLQEQSTETILKQFETVQDNYTQHIRHFTRFVRETGGAVDIETIKQYYLWLNTTSYTSGTIRVRRQAVKRRIRDLFGDVSEEQRAFLEVQLTKLDKAQSTKCPGGSSCTLNEDKMLKAGEYEIVLSGCRSSRQKRFIEFLYTTGARVSELCKAKISECTIEGNVVSVRLHGKGNKGMSEKHRTVFITRAMYDRILETFAGSTYLFETGGGKMYSGPYVSNQIRKITKKTIGRALSAHKL